MRHRASAFLLNYNFRKINGVSNCDSNLHYLCSLCNRLQTAQLQKENTVSTLSSTSVRAHDAKLSKLCTNVSVRCTESVCFLPSYTCSHLFTPVVSSFGHFLYTLFARVPLLSEVDGTELYKSLCTVQGGRKSETTIS